MLDLAFRVFRKLEPALLRQVAFLAWISDQEADNYYKESERLLQETLNDDLVKEKWVHNKLFTSNTKQELEAMCVAKGMNSVGKKHELVAKLAEEKGADRDVCIYDGIINNVPSSVSQLNKKPVRYLWAVLSHHGILSVGTKEELIIRIGLLKCGQQQAVFSRERKALVELISMFKELLDVERKQNRQGILTRKRANASNETSLMMTREAASAKKETISPPQEIESRSVTETLYFLEKKSFWRRNRCNLSTENLSRLQRNSEMAQVQKEQGQPILSQDRTLNEIVKFQRNLMNLSTTWPVTLWQLEAK